MYKSGFAGLIGRPNSGKSTLLNAILGEELAITSQMPQTTRHAIRGIHSIAESQIVFIDTPGIHQNTDKFGSTLNQISLSILKDSDVDVIIYVVDVSRRYGEEEEYIFSAVKNLSIPAIIVLNKIDTEHNFLSFYENKLSGYDLIKISALNKTNIDALIKKIISILPEAPPFYDTDQLTDKDLRFIASEIIRKQVIHNLREEIPHATTVKIEAFRDLPDGSAEIEAVIFVETDNQKMIMIGKDGVVIKKIKHFSRRELKKFIPGTTTLDISIKVRHKWRKNKNFLNSIGYD